MRGRVAPARYLSLLPCASWEDSMNSPYGGPPEWLVEIATKPKSKADQEKLGVALAKSYGASALNSIFYVRWRVIAARCSGAKCIKCTVTRNYLTS